MTFPSPSVDPALVARLADEFVALSAQLGRVGADLGALRQQLARPVQPPMPPRPQIPFPVAPQQRMPIPPQQAWIPPNRVPPQPFPVARPTRKREPWWQRDGVVSRLLAFAGAGVTLVGVVMLLVLAAQAGFFGPVARVVAGAVFSVALVGLGMRIFGRPGGAVGGIALAATGIAGVYLDVVAVVAVYGWIVPPLGLLVGLGVCAFGIALAAKWNAQPLALLVVTGVALLAPVLTSGPTLTLVGFLIVLQIACFPVQLVRSWPYLHVARTVPVVLALVYAIPLVDDSGAHWLLASAIVTALVGVGTGIAAVRRDSTDTVASIVLAVATLPILFSPALVGRTSVAIIAGIVSVVALVIAAARVLPNHARVAVLPTAVLALLETCFAVGEFETYPIGLLVVAVGFIAAAGPVGSRIAYRIGIGFGVLGGIACYATAPLGSLVLPSEAVDHLGAWVPVSGLLLVAVAALQVWQAQRMGLRLDTRLALGGLIALYATTATAVAAGVAIAGTDGFTAGHCAATILWMLGATVLLSLGLRGEGTDAVRVRLTLGAGLALVGAALGKLFLFDLATLDGLVRVLAFVVVGLLLLAAGTRYARVFAERGAAAKGTPSGASPAATAR